MKKIAIFGGSFNPPGKHHRSVVNTLIASGEFDEIVVIPCGGRPDKPSVNDVPPEHRAAMADLVFGRLPKTRVELFDLESDTFTPNCRLDEIFKEKGEVWHVVGTDLVVGGRRGESLIQKTWKRGMEIWQNLNFVVVARPGYPCNKEDLPPHFKFFDEDYPEVSSTNIRELIYRGGEFSGLMTDAAASYIRRYGLYRGIMPHHVHHLQLTEPRVILSYDERNLAACKMAETLKDYVVESDPNLIIALGGDGTMLKAIRRHWRERLPFLGLNFGHKGYLLNDVPPSVDDLMRGNLAAYHMPLLYVETRDADGRVQEALAFNDAWVERVNQNTAWMRIRQKGQVVMEKLVGDGALVATPNGSNVYARAMGAQPVPINSQTIVLVGSNVLEPNGWKVAHLPFDSLIEIEAVDPARRPIKASVDDQALGEVVSMKVRLSRIAAAELLFDPSYDINRKMVESQFPRHRVLYSTDKRQLMELYKTGLYDV